MPEPIPAGAADARTTFLREQLGGYEALQQARDLASHAQWERAAEAYQNIVEQFGDALLRSPNSSSNAGGAATRPAADGAIEYFVSLPDAVLREVAAGAPDLRRAYVRRYEHAARRALDRAGSDSAAAYRAARRFLPTTAAMARLEEIADADLEAARFVDAAQLYGELDALTPPDAPRRRVWQAKRALCRAWQGDRSAISRLLADWPAGEPGPHVRWCGQTRPLREAVAAWSATGGPTTTSHPTSDAVASTVRGSADRKAADAAAGDFRPEARLWRFTEFKPVTAIAMGDSVIEEVTQTEPPSSGSATSGRHLGLRPIAMDGLILVADDRSVWAIDPDSPDEALWQFPLMPGTGRDSPDDRWMFQEQAPPVYTLSAADGVVYAHLERTIPDGGDTPDTSTLVALDARTGRPLWSNTLAALVAPFDQCRLDGAPLVLADRLVAVARRRKNFGFETALLVGFNRRTGEIEWQTHLGEAATGGYGYQRPTRTYPVAVGRNIFVHTNLGAIACVRADDGRIAWLRRYASAFADPAAAAAYERSMKRPLPWRHNPTLAWRDQIIVAANDRDDILVLDQADGRVTRSVASESLHQPDSILGVVADRLFAAGSWTVAYDLAAGRIAWERMLPDGQLLGRAALTATSVLLPTSVGLLQYPLDGGTAERVTWTAGQAGNLLPLNDCLLVASGDALTAWVSAGTAFERLDRRLKSDPSDPRPALMLAELAMQTGDGARGVRSIDEAIRRAGGAARLYDPRLRQRIYRICMEYVGDAVNAARNHGDEAAARLPIALQLLDRAAFSAPGIDGQVRQFLRRGEVCLLTGEPARAADAYQQLLSDPGLAARPVAVEGTSEIAAGHLARDRISRLILEQGRAVYGTVERRAAEQLRIAVTSGDLKALSAVADRYPNSLAAPEALIRGASLHTSRNHPDDAARMLRRALGFRDQVDAPHVMQLLAEALTAADRKAAAAGWLDRAAREFPDYRMSRDGRTVSFGELRDLLLETEWLAAAARCRLAFPLQRQWSREFADAPAVLEPPLWVAPETARDRVMVVSEGKLHLLSPVTGRPLWGAPPDCPAKPLLLALTPERAVLATRDQLKGIDLASGQVAWQMGGDPRVANDPAVDPEATVRWSVHAAGPQRVYAATDDGELFALRTLDGHVDWRIATQPKIGTRIAADARRVAFVSWFNRENVVVLLDAATGAVIRRSTLAAERPVQLLNFTDDGCLLAVTASTLHAMDPESGNILWSASLPGRAFLATYCVGLDGIYLSTDGVTLSRFDLLTGRPQWTTRPLAGPANATFRAQAMDELVVVATDRTLFGIDARSGAIVWQQDDVVSRDALAARLVRRDLLLTSDLPSEEAENPVARLNDAAQRDGGDAERPATLVLRRFDAATGKATPVVGSDDRAVQRGLLELAPSESVFVCEPGLIIRSGKSLIGYLGAAPTPRK